MGPSLPQPALRIAIDGPAGTGKSTVARLVAHHLGLPLLNSGQLYRSVAYLMKLGQLDMHNADEATRIATTMKVEVVDGVVQTLNGQDVRGRLSADEVSAATPMVAQYAGVREALMAFERAYAQEHGVVMEGRSIGTTVLPEAEYKFYLVCDPEVRARRRQSQGLHETAAQLLERDRLDAERSIAPLQKAPDAIEIDTTELTAEETTTKILNFIDL